MSFSVISNGNSLVNLTLPKPSLSPLKPIYCSKQQNPENTINKPIRQKTHLLNPKKIALISNNPNRIRVYEERSEVGIQQMLILCGFGYWVQGFRCFPWLGLNFHMAHNLNLSPSTLQLVQNFANLPMVAKPLYGVFSDAVYIGGAHRIPYVSIGVLLQVFSWVALALIQASSEPLPSLMACVLLGNLGASITEVAKDALVTEYGQRHKIFGLQSYAFMASAAGGILGNLIAGFFLLKTQNPKSMFFIFASLLALQLRVCLATKEEPANHYPNGNSKSENIRKQCWNLAGAIQEEKISGPLIWVVASIAMVPILSGSIFCYQTQFLGLDPSIIGLSKVIGQLILLFVIVLYNHSWREVPLRKLVKIVQVLYASSILLDLVLVERLNLRVHIPNDAFALCFSALPETIAQFKLLPFLMLFARLAPAGCEGSLVSLLGSGLCLASIFSGFLGVGLATVLGIRLGDYSPLSGGILVQFFAALVPLIWIDRALVCCDERERKGGRSRRRRRNRRVGRVVLGSVYAYRRERESEGDR